MTAEQLRNSFLQEAFAGKLVPQNLSDGNANEILSAIHKEKLRFVKEGMIKKKELVDIPIGEHEIPYEIPSNWMWVRLRSVVYNHGQKTPTNKFSYIDIGSIDNKHQRLNLNENIIEAKNAPSRARKIVTAGDIIYSTVRPYLHNMAIIDREFTEEPIASTGFAVFTCHQGLFNKFLFYYLLSPAFDSYANDGDNAKGVAYPAINDDKLYKAIIPLPPLAEQQRIVAKLEELLPIVEQYGKAQTELDELNAALPARLRQSILQEAISGRLVPQDPNDEPAAVLLQRIREENARLVKAKQISKRDFEVLPITEDDVDFDIPVTWEWVRLGDIFKHSTGKALNEANKKGCLHDYITTSNVYWGYFKLDKLRQMYYTEDEKEKCMATKGDLLVLEGGDVGRAAIWDKDYDIFLQNHIHKLRAYIPVCTKFYYYCLYLFHDMGLVGGKGIGIQGLSSGALHQIIFPLPPLAEQQRIVAKIEELFAEIDKMK